MHYDQGLCLAQHNVSSLFRELSNLLVQASSRLASNVACLAWDRIYRQRSLPSYRKTAISSTSYNTNKRRLTCNSNSLISMAYNTLARLA